MARTCRPDKLTLAALEATLAVYASGRAWDEIPVLKMLRSSEDSLKERAERLGGGLANRGWVAGIVPDTTECGGAVLPGFALPTWGVELRHEHMSEEELYVRLLIDGVVSRRKNGGVLLDLRSVPVAHDSRLLRIVSSIE